MTRRFLALGVGLLVLAGCAKIENQTRSQASAPEVGVTGRAYAGEDVAKSAAPEEAAKTPALPRKIIYTADVNLICESLSDTGAKVEAKVKEFGGYVSGRQMDGASGVNRTASWTVRVPAEKFEAFLAALPGMGELQSATTSSQDVSEEFYDATARLKNKRIEEERLVQLLKSATGRLTEILTVEKEISRVREEIERIEGRLRYLSSQADLSTVTLHVSEVRGYIPPRPPGLGTEVGRSFTSSVDALGAVLKGFLLLLVALLPWLTLAGGAVVGILYALKNLGGKKEK